MGLEGRPRLSLPGVKAPACVSFSSEDINEHAVAAANVYKARKWWLRTTGSDVFQGVLRAWSIHIPPHFDQEGCNAQILEDVLAWLCGLHPSLAQAICMPSFQV